MSVATHLCCFACGLDQAMEGPSGFAMDTFPDWDIDQLGFYNPFGSHYCPRHRRRAWTVYCNECLGTYDEWWGHDIIVDTPREMTGDDVVLTMGEMGISCRQGHHGNFGLEAIDAPFYHGVQPKVRYRL